MMISSIIQQHPISHKGISVNTSPAAWQVWGKGPRAPTPTFILGKKKNKVGKKPAERAKQPPTPKVWIRHWMKKLHQWLTCTDIIRSWISINAYWSWLSHLELHNILWAKKKQSIVIFVGKNAVKRSNRAVLSFLISLKILVVWWKGIQNIVTQSSKNVLKECLQNSN